jgi:hypothetical protein
VAEPVRLFLSTVSDEFRANRDQLRGDLTRHNVEVKVRPKTITASAMESFTHSGSSRDKTTHSGIGTTDICIKPGLDLISYSIQ